MEEGTCKDVSETKGWDLFSTNANSSSLLGMHCLYVYTKLGRNFVLFIHEDDNISKVKENIYKEYTNLYSKIGDVKISALKVKRRGCFFDLCDSVVLRKLFGPKDEMFLTVEFEKIEESVEQNNTNTVATEKPLEAAIRVHNTNTKKRRLKTVDANNAALSEKVVKKRTKRSKKSVSDPIMTKSKETDVAIVAVVSAEHLLTENQTGKFQFQSVSDPIMTKSNETVVAVISAELPTENQTAEKTVVSDTLESIANLQVIANEASLQTNQAGNENIEEGIAMDAVESTDNLSVANPSVSVAAV